MSHTFRSLFTAVDSAPTQADLDIANLVSLYTTSNPNYDFPDESHEDTDSNSIKVYSRTSNDGSKKILVYSYTDTDCGVGTSALVLEKMGDFFTPVGHSHEPRTISDMVKEDGISSLDSLKFKNLLDYITYSWDNYKDSIGEGGFSVAYLLDSLVEIRDVAEEHYNLDVIVENISNAYGKVD
jgi:hypothetical protein